MKFGCLGLPPLLAVVGVMMQAMVAVAESLPEEMAIPPAEPLAYDSLTDESFADNALDQVTSVSQLSDVQPSDWAYEALRSLVEQYGCISGDAGVFQGGRSLTRYEFAAGLNACLDRINELVTQDLGGRFSAEDLTRLQRLQEEFSSELEALRGRMDDLENRTAELEANQFSTTTSLRGQTIIAFNGGFQGDADDPNTVLLSRVRLNLVTSFTGTDTLLTQLETGTGGANNDAASFLLRDRGQFQDDLVGDELEAAQTINRFLQTSSALEYSDADSQVRLNRLSYEFAPDADLTLALFAQGYASDYVDRNPYANDDADNFSTFGFVNNQLLLANDPLGAGAALRWNPGAGALTLRAVYRADEAAIAPAALDDGNQGGVFGDPYLGVVELEFAFSNDGAIALQYSGGAQGDSSYDVVGANLQLSLTRQLELFGRFGYAFNFPGDIEPAAWSAGVTLADLFIPGAVGGFAIGQPLVFQEDAIRLFDGTQTNFELFYRLPLSDNISVTPALQLITDPGNQNGNAILTGTLRTVFNF